MKFIVIGVCCSLAVSAATATEHRKIEGTYGFTSEGIVYVDPAVKPDRLVLYINGQGAKDIYKRMTVAALPEPCEPKYRTKTAGGLSCTFDPGTNEYNCSVGVMLNSGKTVSATVC